MKLTHFIESLRFASTSFRNFSTPLWSAPFAFWESSPNISFSCLCRFFVALTALHNDAYCVEFVRYFDMASLSFDVSFSNVRVVPDCLPTLSDAALQLCEQKNAARTVRVSDRVRVLLVDAIAMLWTDELVAVTIDDVALLVIDVCACMARFRVSIYSLGTIAIASWSVRGEDKTWGETREFTSNQAKY